MDIMARGIYRITNLSDGKMTTYIGRTMQSFKHRWALHKSQLRHQKHDNSYLQAAWNRYGEDAFEFDVVEILSDPIDAPEHEQVWLDWFRLNVDVYNIGFVVGKEYQGTTHSQETKEKIRLATSGENHYMYGCKHSEETKEKIRKSLEGTKNPFYGRKHSEESLAKMREAKLGQNNPQWGMPVSDVTRAKISKAKSKPYPAFKNLSTGEVIPSGYNLWQLCKERDFVYPGLYYVAKGKSLRYKDWVLVEKETNT